MGSTRVAHHLRRPAVSKQATTNKKGVSQEKGKGKMAKEQSILLSTTPFKKTVTEI